MWGKYSAKGCQAVFKTKVFHKHLTPAYRNKMHEMPLLSHQHTGHPVCVKLVTRKRGSETVLWAVFLSNCRSVVFPLSNSCSHWPTVVPIEQQFFFWRTLIHQSSKISPKVAQLTITFIPLKSKFQFVSLMLQCERPSCPYCHEL